VTLADTVIASQSPRVIRVLRVLALVPLVLSCAPSGENPTNRLMTWEAPSGDYRIRYLEPPWGLVEEDASGAYFRISSNLMIFGDVDGGPGKYDLRTSVIAGAVPMLMDSEVRRATSTSGRVIQDGPRSITTDEGVVGSELLLFDEPDPIERYRRVVLLPLSTGNVLRLDFAATPDLDTDEVSAMIRNVGIGVEVEP